VSLRTDSFASGVVSWKGLLSCLFEKKNGFEVFDFGIFGVRVDMDTTRATPTVVRSLSPTVGRPSADPPIPIRPLWMSAETAAAVPSTERLMESPTLRSRRGGCRPAGSAAVAGDRDGDSRCGD
jgi:hypothetical protein